MEWNGRTLVKTLAENELKAAAIYRAVAANARKGDLFFEQMAEDEERHEKIYAHLLEEAEEADLNIIIDDDDANYLDLLMSESIFNNYDEEIKNAKKIYDKSRIYEISEKIERETVNFVQEVIRLFPDFAPEEMKKILGEERRHLGKILERKRDDATKGLGL